MILIALESEVHMPKTLRGVLLLCLLLTFVSSFTHSQDQERTYLFPGGVTLTTKSDEMTDKKVCALFTAMRGAQITIQEDGKAAVWIHQSYHPSKTLPPPLMRIAEDPPFELSVSDRPNLLLIPPEHNTDVINALYGGKRIRLRISDWPSGDQKNFELEAGDFGAGYDRACNLCGWKQLQIARAPLSKEPKIYRGEDGYVRAEIPGGVWIVTFLPKYRSCDISAYATGGLATVFSARNGVPDQVLEMGRMVFKDADDNPVAEVTHNRFDIAPIQSIIAAAKKAGEYGTMTVKYNPYLLYGFQEAVDFAEKTCGIQIR